MQYKAAFLVDHDLRSLVLLCDLMSPNREWRTPFTQGKGAQRTPSCILTDFFIITEKHFPTFESDTAGFYVVKEYGLNKTRCFDLYGHKRFDVQAVDYDTLGNLNLHPVVKRAVDEHESLVRRLCDIYDDMDTVISDIQNHAHC